MDWYYGEGGGIYLPPTTRRLYLKVKKNLLCPEDEIEPMGALNEVARKHPELNSKDQRSRLAIRQISLRRWVMRLDLDIETDPYFKDLAPMEVRLLEESGISPDQPPFSRFGRAVLS